MVGTFYRSPSPEAKPFVQVERHGEEGRHALHHRSHEGAEQIEAEEDGVIKEVLVEKTDSLLNSDQPLFILG